MISNRRYLLLASLLAIFFLCNVAASKDSYAEIVEDFEEDEADTITDVDHEERDLTFWVQPSYWENYNKCFTSTYLKKCLLMKAPPLQGSFCLSGLLSWHTCFFGAQTCTAITGHLPGLGDFYGAGLGTNHPRTRCDCRNGSWNCYDWKICQASPTPKPSLKPFLPPPTPPPTPVPTPMPTLAPVPTQTFCGGIAGIQCPSGLICVDDPNDSCDPNYGGADCGGICVPQDVPQSCGSRGLPPCPDGQSCIDLDPTDSCSPLADCPGVCAPTPPPSGCGGWHGIPCPSGQVCVDDPSNCGLAADCLGMCIPAPAPEPPCDQCPFESPLTLPRDTICSKQLTCTYGKESCCGYTYDSLICSCQPGQGFSCYNTDKCRFSVCDTKPPPGITPREYIPPPVQTPAPVATPPPVQTIPPLPDVPDVHNNQYCPKVMPQSKQSCPLKLLHATSCGYGEVCCCNDCSPKTTCLANFGIFQCLSIAIKCTSNCLLPIIPAVCEVKKKSWPELVGKLHSEAKAIILREEPCVSKVDAILEWSPVTFEYNKNRVRVFYSAWSGKVVQVPQCG